MLFGLCKESQNIETKLPNTLKSVSATAILQMSSKLSTSFSAHDLRSFSSYREQRMNAKPPSTTEIGDHQSCWTARNDLENIQQCLRKSLYKRRESYGDKDSHTTRHEPLDAVLGRLNREIEGISSPKASDSAIEEVNRYKVLNKYVLAESTLNTIEENPRPQAHNLKKQALTMSIKSQSRPTLNANKNLLTTSAHFTKQLIQVSKVTTPTANDAKTLLTSKPSLKKTLSRPVTNYKSGATKADTLRISKKVEQLRDQVITLPFKKQQEMLGYLNQIMELMREQ